MTLVFKIQKDINLVFDYLTDMQKFVSVHPVIFQIDSKGNENYLVHETLKLGFIPFSFTYPVTIEKSNTLKTVTIRALVFKLTKIEMKFVLNVDGEFTTIIETIDFNSTLPVKSMMKRIFRKQHEQLFRNMERLHK